MNSTRIEQVGIISDTHGIFRHEIATVFKDVQHIFHAGDIGKPDVLQNLNTIAPTTAVLGNVDVPSLFPQLKKLEVIKLPGYRILLIHDIEGLKSIPSEFGISVIINGHSHKTEVKTKGSILYINPGSAGPVRFHLKPSVSILTLSNPPSVKSFELKL